MCVFSDERLTAEQMDEQRIQNVAYQYLCRLEEAKRSVMSHSADGCQQTTAALLCCQWFFFFFISVASFTRPFACWDFAPILRLHLSVNLSEAARGEISLRR